MIKVSKTLTISAEEFFDVLISSIKEDLDHANIEVKSGLTYEKSISNKLGRSGNISVEIEEYLYPKQYKAKFSSGEDVNYISYHVDTLDAHTISVTYQEDFFSTNKIRNLNYKVMIFFYKKSSLKRMEMILEHIEKK